MLTAKQERFVQELAKGKSQREAYKASYNAEKMKDASIDRVACRLFAQVNVRSRYEEIMAEIKDRTIDDAEEMRRFILDKYKKIASGDLCEESVIYDSEGEVVQRRKTVRPKDVNDAITKLAEYYGIKPEEKPEPIEVILHGAEGYDV